jgi:transcriptional regulator with XRE-family HTH domain
VIRSFRLSAGLSQAELAAGADMSPSMLSMVESGRREPTISALRRLAARLGVGAGVLFAAALADDDGKGRPDPALHEVTALLIDVAKKQILFGAVLNRTALGHGWPRARAGGPGQAAAVKPPRKRAKR